MTEESDNRRTISVYGAECSGHKIPERAVEKSGFIINFDQISTSKDLSENDGIILMCNLFESRSGKKIECDNRPEMRSKQVYKLLNKGGFVSEYSWVLTRIVGLDYGMGARQLPTVLWCKDDLDTFLL